MRDEMEPVPSFDLTGRVALVTGAARGLGRASALALASAGATVALGLRDVQSDRGLVQLIERRGGTAIAAQMDVTDLPQCYRAVDVIVGGLGGIDILVNSAGVVPIAPVLEFGRAEWDATIAVNLTAAFELSFEVARHMVPRRSGKIINVCSLFSFLGGRFSPAYAASKHGIAGLTKAYCDELAPYGIQVNGIAPGYYATALTAPTRNDPEASKRISDRIPSGRWGEPLDLMGTVVFLASRASDYVNGQILAVDGGYLVR